MRPSVLCLSAAYLSFCIETWTKRVRVCALRCSLQTTGWMEPDGGNTVIHNNNEMHSGRAAFSLWLLTFSSFVASFTDEIRKKSIDNVTADSDTRKIHFNKKWLVYTFRSSLIINKKLSCCCDSRSYCVSVRSAKMAKEKKTECSHNAVQV